MNKTEEQVAGLLSLYHHKDLKVMNRALSRLITQSITYNKCASAIIDSIELLELVVASIVKGNAIEVQNIPTDYIYIDIHDDPYSYSSAEPRTGRMVKKVLEDHEPDYAMNEEDLYFFHVCFKQDINGLYVILAMLAIQDALVFDNITSLAQLIMDDLKLRPFFVMYHTANGFYTLRNNQYLIDDCYTYLHEFPNGREEKANMKESYKEIVDQYPDGNISNLISREAKARTREIAANISTFWTNANLYKAGKPIAFETNHQQNLRNLIATSCACVVMAEASEETISLSSIFHQIANMGLPYIGMNMETEVKSIKGPVDDTPVNYHVDKNIEYKDIEGEGWD